MTENTHKPYRTVFTGVLHQDSGLSTGGTEGDSSADAIFARDGLNRPILRGAGLSGALHATLDNLMLSPKVESRYFHDEHSEESLDSLWLVHHAHLLTPDATPQTRPHVAIQPWSGSAVPDLYFSTEVLPRGTQWQLVIETEDWRDEWKTKGNSASSLLMEVLSEWERGHCWLGRSPSRGLGWITLKDLRVYELDGRAATCWPDATLENSQKIDFLHKQSGVANTGITLRNPTSILQAEHQRKSEYRIFTGKISIGEQSDGYGLNTLSTLGLNLPETTGSDERSSQTSATDADSSLASSLTVNNSNPEQKYEYLIPGSGIRGSIRAALSTLLNEAGFDIWQPNAFNQNQPGGRNDPLLPLFGSIEHDSHLLISDAYSEGEPPVTELLEHHAEDEFTQSTYASDKFDRPCIVSGEFTFKLSLKIANTDDGAGLTAEQLTTANKILQMVNELGENHRIPVGGGIWKGHGWVRLSISEDEENEVISTT